MTGILVKLSPPSASLPPRQLRANCQSDELGRPTGREAEQEIPTFRVPCGRVDGDGDGKEIHV